MTYNRNSKSSIPWASIFCFIGASQLLAQKNEVKLAPPLKPAQEREDYQQCVTAVIKKHKSTENTKKNRRLQAGLATCRDRYPAVAILSDCKKELATAFKDDPDALKASLVNCREEYQKYSFQPQRKIPFVARGEQLFFAGVGLNLSHSLRPAEDELSGSGLYMGENFGNFSCSNLSQSIFREQEPEYLLFGNDPFLYKPLRHADRAELLRAVGLAAALDKPAKPLVSYHQDFGELHYEAQSNEFYNYFPLSHCRYDRKLGQLFEGLKIYYLLDRSLRQVTPYFGIAFYRPETAIHGDRLAEEVQQLLGMQYQVQNTKPLVSFIAQGKLTAFDQEGDPKNLCQGAETTPYLAVITRRPQSENAHYLLLANISNLCRFGDRIASRFLKKAAKQPSASP